MEWKRLDEEKPEEGRSLWLFGINDVNSSEMFDVGYSDKVYGVTADHESSMDVTHWAYCEKPKR